MRSVVIQCEFQRLILSTSTLKSTNLSAHYRAESCATNLNFTHPFLLRAASSSSPSSYSEPLIGEQVKRKQRSIAGIDQDELLDPRHLADPDSCFYEFKGVHIHYKVCEPEPEPETQNTLEEQSLPLIGDQNRKIGLPLILLHGFGASVFSWHRVMKPFAQIIGSKVLAFDRPAFGLTSRIRYLDHSQANDDKPLNPYSVAFSVLVTLQFIDFLAAEKAVLVGHSAGSLTALDAYFEAPDRVAALIFVAPAILAPASSSKVANKNLSGKANQTQESGTGLDRSPNLFGRLVQILSKLYQYIITAILRVWRGMLDMVNSLYRKVLVAILRSALAVMLVRMIIDKFGIAAVRNAWCDANQVTDHIIQGYTKPLRTKDWDRALVEYTVAMLTDSQGKQKPPLEERLKQISCPVLIVTGDKDRLVPSWNSKRLSRAIPGSQLEVIKNCGHLPQEEKPEEFTSVVANFLQRVFAGSGEFCLQT